MVGDALEVVVNYANEEGWLLPATAAFALLLALGLQGYSALKEPSDTWDEILRIGAIALIVVSAMALIGMAIQHW